MTLMFDESKTLSVVCNLFSKEFENGFSTKLVGGADEPLYLPKNESNTSALLLFRSNFLSSALHFGYWYSPDGRSEIEQEAFEFFEVKPQALEWMFSKACNHSFTISLDNLSITNSVCECHIFFNFIIDQIADWCASDTLPPRGLKFLNALSSYFHTEPKSIDHYSFDSVI